MDFTVQCPHCKLYVMIQEINCSIFRHGVYKDSKQQINPHENKENCDRYIKEDLIIGCGKPFRLVLKNNEYFAIECDYI